jgi:hypothetical protein
MSRLSAVLALALTLPVVSGCIQPGRAPGVGEWFAARPPVLVSPEEVMAGLAPADSAPSVVMRTYRGSPFVNVLAWYADDAMWGLRAAVRHDGTLSRGVHTLYVSPYYFANVGSAVSADWEAFAVGETEGQMLRFTGSFSDVHSCEGTKGCTPYHVLTVRVSDALLRRSRDGVVVRIRGRLGSEEVLALRPELISTYLTTVDSVVWVRRYAANATR